MHQIVGAVLVTGEEEREPAQRGYPRRDVLDVLLFRTIPHRVTFRRFITPRTGPLARPVVIPVSVFARRFR
ncbi:hypothetical protein [Actinoplanes siamensis]|uniref:Uncharacterized protein n=1 Tax=Actinoplanes siamensis TaxID=1223317 RepID=A0A919TNV2_9ACTN|nr:hypothetical protein [Actinoplanes siamensis]GIF09174.1 hypothetical protein Asi03nite_67120 [Actinoplanes siamensis]